MIKLIVIFALALAALSACASNPAPMASNDSMVEAAKRLAVEECRPQEFDAYMDISGCQYEASFMDGKWGVFVITEFVKKDGSRTEVMGGHSLYMFTQSGKFIARIPGM